jgi:hypothetical protein
MLTIQQLQEIINRHFTPPFLPAGHVRASINEDSGELSLVIGPRDVSIDPDGNVTGAGTWLGGPEEE